MVVSRCWCPWTILLTVDWELVLRDLHPPREFQLVSVKFFPFSSVVHQMPHFSLPFEPILGHPVKPWNPDIMSLARSVYGDFLTLKKVRGQNGPPLPPRATCYTDSGAPLQTSLLHMLVLRIISIKREWNNILSLNIRVFLMGPYKVWTRSDIDVSV